MWVVRLGLSWAALLAAALLGIATLSASGYRVDVTKIPDRPQEMCRLDSRLDTLAETASIARC